MQTADDCRGFLLISGWPALSLQITGSVGLKHSSKGILHTVIYQAWKHREVSDLYDCIFLRSQLMMELIKTVFRDKHKEGKNNDFVNFKILG